MLTASLIALTLYSASVWPAFAASDATLAKREVRQHRLIWRYDGTLAFFAHRPVLARSVAGRVALHRAHVWLRVTRRELAETRAERRARRPVRSLQASSVDGCLSELISRESGWNVTATNPSTGAYGLPQALPGSKMASAGADWATNPQTQIRWMLGYVQRYGGSCGALAFQRANGWY